MKQKYIFTTIESADSELSASITKLEFYSNMADSA